MLDGICESLLGAGTRFSSADEVAAALADYVGDPAVVAAAEAERLRTQGNTLRRTGSDDTDATGALPAVPETVGGPVVSDDTALTPVVPLDVHAGVAEDDTERTQIGAPVFDDDAVIADPDWHQPSEEAPAPPPPFEEPPERPLFAPDPPEGRLRRLPPPTADERGYWPFNDTGSLPMAPIAPEPEPAEAVPGRSWLRIALVLLGVLALLPVLYVVAGLVRDDGDPTGSGSGGPRASSTPLRGVTATAFDPPPGDGEEHDDEARLAVDRDRATAWTTSGYDQNFGPGGLKPGVGLVLDLGTSQTVRSVDVTVTGGATTLQLLAAGETAPATIEGLEVVATADGDATITLTPDEGVDSRYLVLWLTSVPQVGGDFRGAIAHVEVHA